MKKVNNYRWPFILVTSLFFLWGFVHNLDPILIPHFCKAFPLSTLGSSPIAFAVFIAFFAMALPAGMNNRKCGYKTGIIIGLFLFAFGSFLFVPVADITQYVFFLGALFVEGAFLLPVLRYIAVETNSIQDGSIIPLLCFIVVIYFRFKGQKLKPVTL